MVGSVTSEFRRIHTQGDHYDHHPHPGATHTQHHTKGGLTHTRWSIRPTYPTHKLLRKAATLTPHTPRVHPHDARDSCHCHARARRIRRTRQLPHRHVRPRRTMWLPHHTSTNARCGTRVEPPALSTMSACRANTMPVEPRGSPVARCSRCRRCSRANADADDIRALDAKHQR